MGAHSGRRREPYSDRRSVESKWRYFGNRHHLRWHRAYQIVFRLTEGKVENEWLWRLLALHGTENSLSRSRPQDCRSRGNSFNNVKQPRRTKHSRQQVGTSTGASVHVHKRGRRGGCRYCSRSRACDVTCRRRGADTAMECRHWFRRQRYTGGRKHRNWSSLRDYVVDLGRVGSMVYRRGVAQTGAGAGSDHHQVPQRHFTPGDRLGLLLKHITTGTAISTAP